MSCVSWRFSGKRSKRRTNAGPQQRAAPPCGLAGDSLILTRHAFAWALRGSGLKALDHELDDGRPAGKVEAGAQRADVGKELTAAGDEFAQAGKAFIEPVKQGVQQVGPA